MAADIQSLHNQISNLQLENHYLMDTLKTEREVFAKAKNDYDWAIFNKTQADLAVANTNKNIEVRDKLILDLNTEIESLNKFIIKLQSKLETSTKMVNDLTNQNIKLLEKLNS